MNNITADFVHPRFRMNGFGFTADDIGRVAYSFIKEGAPFEVAIGTFLLDWVDAKDFVPMQTSGTTGTPKQILVSKQAMVNSALATGQYFDLPAGTRALHCLPAQFVAGKLMLVRAILLGWDIDLAAPSSKPLEGNDNTYNFSAMVPLQAQESIDKLEQVDKIILGGAKVSPELAEQLKGLSTQVFETYGMTETVTHIAAKRVGEAVFETLPGVAVETDSRGCLVIHAPLVANEKVITNDVAHVPDDNHFTWLGRIDNVINSGGVKLHPEQIEDKLAPYLNNRRFFITAVPDATLGEKLVLVVEGEPFGILENAWQNLGKFERPKEIRFAATFNETGSGKVQRTETLKNAKATVSK